VLTRLAVLILASGSLSACQSDPHRQLADSALVALMVDLRLLEAAAGTGDTTRLAERRDSVFAIHRTDTTVYRTELEARSDDLSEYLELYDAVLARLNEIRLEEGAQRDEAFATPGSAGLEE
jgi:hypothetical protein